MFAVSERVTMNTWIDAALKSERRTSVAVRGDTGQNQFGAWSGYRDAQVNQLEVGVVIITIALSVECNKRLLCLRTRLPWHV